MIKNNSCLPAVSTKYNPRKTKPSGNRITLLTGLKMMLLFATVVFAASCKTCNCPAYSYDKYNYKQEQATAFYQEPEVMNMSAPTAANTSTRTSDD